MIDALAGRVRLMAAGTHPSSTGPAQITDRPRYRQIAAELPLGAPPRAAERPPRPRRARRRRRGARRLQRRARLPPRAGGALGELAVLRGKRRAARLDPAEARRGPSRAPASRRRSRRGASWPRSSPGAPTAGTSPTSRTCGGTSGSGPTSARSSFASPTRSTRSITRAALAARLPVPRLRAAPPRALGRAAPDAPDARDQREPLAGRPRRARRRARRPRDRARAAPARARIAALLLELEPYAAELGCSDELELAWPMLVRNGARRQRDVAADARARRPARLARDRDRAGRREPRRPARSSRSTASADVSNTGPSSDRPGRVPTLDRSRRAPRVATWQANCG